MAFEKKRNIIQNASFHLNQAVIIGLDVKDFFPSLKFKLVWKYFRKQNIASEPARLVAMLCTYNGHLPQGAITSPILANRLLKEFDETMLNYCKQLKVNYSRYADDITLSGDINTTLKEKLISFVREELHFYKLHLNNEKIRIQYRHNRQEVTGITVNEKLQAPRKLRRELRQKMYYINCYWEKDWHILTENNLDKLLGSINFVWSIDKENLEFTEYRKQLLEIKRYFILKNKEK
jgi:RNA-directed DNA polymerase